MFVCPVPKISVLMKWRCQNSLLGRLLWHNGRRAKQLSVVLLCGTTGAELHNSVNLLSGTAAAEVQNSEDLLCETTDAELHNSVNLFCGRTAAELNNLV